jgi:hypothetical protein
MQDAGVAIGFDSVVGGSASALAPHHLSVPTPSFLLDPTTQGKPNSQHERPRLPMLTLNLTH